VGKKLYFGNMSFGMTDTDFETYVRRTVQFSRPRLSRTGTPAAQEASVLSRWTVLRQPKRLLTR
jgi:hypothetical protein